MTLGFTLLLVITIFFSLSTATNPATIQGISERTKDRGTILFEIDFDDYPGINGIPNSPPEGAFSPGYLRPGIFEYVARGYDNGTYWGQNELYRYIYAFNGEWCFNATAESMDSSDISNFYINFSTDLKNDGNVNYSLDDPYNNTVMGLEFDWRFDTNNSLT